MSNVIMLCEVKTIHPSDNSAPWNQIQNMMSYFFWNVMQR